MYLFLFTANLYVSQNTQMMQLTDGHFVLHKKSNASLHLRAVPRKYQLDVEIVKKCPGLKLSQNKALWALVTKSLV